MIDVGRRVRDERSKKGKKLLWHKGTTQLNSTQLIYYDFGHKLHPTNEFK